MEIEQTNRFKANIKKAKQHLGYKNEDVEEVTTEDLLDIIEDLMSVIEHIEEELRDLEQDLQDNYRPIPRKDQYE